jgi:hypothetical protein
MTREELERRLVKEEVSPDAYDLTGSERHKFEAYCLERVENGWVVYYRERDIRRDERLFSFENDACLFLLDQILRDPTTRMQK